MKVDLNPPTEPEDDMLKMTTSIVTAFVAHNKVQSEALPELIHSVHSTLSGLDNASTVLLPPTSPAVPIAKSITNEYLICLEDGRQLKMLKRYLRAKYRLTPDEYRARWDLPEDYPMVAPAYAKKRSDFAKEIGLGRKRTSPAN